MNTPTIAVTAPMVGTISGNTRPCSPNAALPRISAATSVTAYDSNRSAAMPAQSPTLSPTLSAIVAALRGSSSGMPCSTLPTRSAPTSAALVKRSEEHTSELQSRSDLVCRLLLEKKKKTKHIIDVEQKLALEAHRIGHLILKTNGMHTPTVQLINPRNDPDLTISGLTFTPYCGLG